MSGKSEKRGIRNEFRVKALHSMVYTCPLCNILGYPAPEVQKHTRASTQPDPGISRLQKEYPDLGQNVARSVEKYSTKTIP